MHADLEKLLELQQTDAEIARLRQEITALPKRVAEIETKLTDVNAQVEGAKAALKDIESKRRKHEGDIQTLQQKISKYRDQSLAVKTNQEYRALLDEISFAEKEVRRIEDKILEGMMESEDRQRLLKSAEAEQAVRRAEVEREKEQARQRTQQDEADLRSLMPRREELRGGIDPDRLRHYVRVLRLRGSALSQVVDQKCTACQVMLRPQVFNDVRTDEYVLTCDSCNRILYYVPPAEPEPIAAPATDSAPPQS